jgi:hypothetical protein
MVIDTGAQIEYDNFINNPTIFTTIDDSAKQEHIDAGPEISPFFLIEHGASLNYSPVVLIPNYDWYVNKSLDYYSETYIPEIRVNGTVADLGTLTHEDLLAVGIDWNVFGYGMQSFHHVNYTVYAGNGTLLASDVIDVDIQLDEQPAIDYENPIIEIGLMDYYHNTYPSDLQYVIHPNGLVLYSRFGSEGVSVFEAWIKKDKYREILDVIWNNRFFNFKSYYFGPDDSIFFDVTYYTEVELNGESHHRFFTGLTSPVIAIQLWEYIASEVYDLNYIPREGIRIFGRSGFWGLTWKWWFVIFGGSIGVLITSVFFKRYRR